jgi:hypothetical protein
MSIFKFRKNNVLSMILPNSVESAKKGENAMDTVCQVEHWQWEDQCYLIYVYQDVRRAFYTAETQLGPGDRIASDGRSVEEVVEQLRGILPLAMQSRMS